MCGIALNPQRVKPGEPRRYDRDVFLVFPPNRREDNYIPSEWDITIPGQEETSSAISGPSSPGNGESLIQAPREADKQQSTTANNQQNPPPSGDTSKTPPTKVGKKPKKSAPEKQRQSRAAESTSQNEESSGRKAAVAKKVSFDLPNSSIGKKVRFAMDFIAPSRASSRSPSSSSSSSSTISGSNDSFVDVDHPNIPIDAKSNGHHAPKPPTSKLPPNVVAESSSRHRRENKPDPIRKVREWKVDSPAPKSAAPTVEGASRQRRPGTPFEYAAEEEEADLDSELGSSVDRGSAVPSTREQLRNFHTGRNTKRNSGRLDHPPAATDSDLSSELGSNVDNSRPKPLWYRAPSPHQLPSVSDETEEDRYDPLLGVTWRSV